MPLDGRYIRRTNRQAVVRTDDEVRHIELAALECLPSAFIYLCPP